MLIAVPLVVLLALFVSMGMAASMRPVSGGFVNWLAEQARKLPVFGGLSIDQIVRLDRWIVNRLGKHFAAIEGGGVRWLTDLARYVEVVGYWTLLWPWELFKEVRHLTFHTIPRAVKSRTAPIEKQAAQAEATAKAAFGLAHSLPKNAKARDRTKEVVRIQTVAMPHAGEWDWIHKHYDTLKKVVLGSAIGAAGAALPAAPALTMPWGKTAKQLRRRIGRVEALLGVSAFAIMMARVLRLPNPRCLTRGGVGRMARFLCGAPTWLLDLLILGTVEAFIAADLCNFSDLLIKQARLIRPALLELVDVENVLIDAGCGKKPADLELPPLSLPKMPSASVFAT